MRKFAAGFSLFVLLLVFALAFSSPESVNTQERLLHPSLDHLFGTDCYGRDILRLVASGLSTSLLIALSVTALSLLLGTLLAFCFSSRKLPVAPFLFISDTLKAVPGIVLALFLSSISGPGMAKLCLALAAANVPNLARTAYSKAPVLREEAYSKAAEAEGMGETRIFFSHIFPHLWPYLMLQCVSVFSSAVLAEASLSFLGCGVPLTVPSLGRLLSESRGFLLTAWWTCAFPSAVLFLTGLSLELIGKGVREIRA